MGEQNRDRGSIKWTSLMLPEHVEMIRNLWKEDERVEKGILDEQKAVEIDFLLQRALSDNLTVSVKVHNGFDYEHLQLKMKQVNKLEKTVYGVDWKTKDPVKVPLDRIADISIV
ncbi:YolD-like family protein [Halobacillus litoralis]|uniref:YolD-like family protein n=1 Tax=Halobacillus litoralis TaxID=45668 RepID=UPI001CD36B61|nr:YolD-like family protein [Halobacillus litoralis]MCA0971067.1 YolD-like family protein [Halobacillus litoralis]